MKFAEPPQPRQQINLIPTTLDELIPADAPIRLIDELLDQLDWSVFVEQFRYEQRGGPRSHHGIMVAVWAFFRRVRAELHAVGGSRKQTGIKRLDDSL